MTRAFSSTLFPDQHFLVVGLGSNGFSAVKALLAMGARVTAWDDHQDLENAPAHHRLTYAYPRDMRGFDAMILSPGIPHILPAPHPIAIDARAQGLPILSDAEILFRSVRKEGSKARFISVTGTNGKSTTTALTAHILRQAGIPVAAGGNLGPAALALPLLGDDGVYVIEMSSYMLERLDTYHAHAACLLNLTPDHLERHGDMARYAAAKAHIFDNMTAADCAVVSIDDPWCREVYQDLKSKGLQPSALSLRQNADLKPTCINLAGAVCLPGAHNMQNALTAFALAKAVGISAADIQKGCETFPGLPHRQERIAVIGGVEFINDSKATNAESVETALICYDRVIWIAGGQAKAGGVKSLVHVLDRVAHAFLIGQDADTLAETLTALNIPNVNCSTLERAVEKAFKAAKSCGVNVVLFSPACASFDQFKNFEARGEAFRRYVENYAASSTSVHHIEEERR